MAKKTKAVAETAPVAAPATKDRVKPTAVGEAIADRKAALYTELKGLVDKYNESAEFGEFKQMKKIDDATEEKLKEYISVCETECFNALAATPNPMLEAAKVLSFEVVAVKDVKQESGGTVRELQSALKKIDPLRLHKKVEGGIGADKFWWALVDRLNCGLTIAAAVFLEAKNTHGEKLDPQKVRDTIAMSEEAKKLSLAFEDDLKNDEVLLSDVQKVINAMLGDGYSVTMRMVQYLKMAHIGVDRNAMSLKVSRDSNMRWYMLNVCHAAITGNDFVLKFKENKK